MRNFSFLLKSNKEVISTNNSEEIAGCLAPPNLLVFLFLPSGLTTGSGEPSAGADQDWAPPNAAESAPSRTRRSCWILISADRRRVVFDDGLGQLNCVGISVGSERCGGEEFSGGFEDLRMLHVLVQECTRNFCSAYHRE